MSLFRSQQDSKTTDNTAQENQQLILLTQLLVSITRTLENNPQHEAAFSAIGKVSSQASGLNQPVLPGTTLDKKELAELAQDPDVLHLCRDANLQLKPFYNEFHPEHRKQLLEKVKLIAGFSEDITKENLDRLWEKFDRITEMNIKKLEKDELLVKAIDEPNNLKQMIKYLASFIAPFLDNKKEPWILEILDRSKADKFNKMPLAELQKKCSDLLHIIVENPKLHGSKYQPALADIQRQLRNWVIQIPPDPRVPIKFNLATFKQLVEVFDKLTVLAKAEAKSSPPNTPK